MFIRKKKSYSIDKSQLTLILNQLQTALPEIRWVALIDSDGLLIGSSPARSQYDKHKISSMSKALLKLSKRTTKELKNGDTRYVLIAGNMGLTLTITLSSDYDITFILDSDIKFDLMMDTLQNSLVPLIELLKLEIVPL